MSNVLPIHRALLSVSDKEGLVELATALAARGIELLSTGGSARVLRAAGLKVVEVSDHTGFPEIMDGRVKTLVPQIHGGILARRDNLVHMKQAQVHGIAPIDLVVVNLYPFETTVAAGAEPEQCIEQIDIGGPALIRAAAKNHDFVAVLTAPDQYPDLLAELAAEGGTTLPTRRHLAGEAFAHTAAYDAAIATWFAERRGELLPPVLTLAGHRRESLRYGENPHQQAAFYTTPGGQSGRRPGVATARQMQGKALSYNNLNDTDAAFECVAEFDAPTVVIVKHANPCGVASAETLELAWERALACDPTSAFGGIVAMNRALDPATAERIGALFTEVVIAPDAEPDALAVLSRRPNLRVLLTGAMPDPTAPGVVFRSLAGGFLAQTRDSGRTSEESLKTVTRRAPNAQEMADLLFAFRVCKHVKSNAIVYARNGATVGIGAGQMSRVDSARIAALKSGEAAGTAGSVVASDAFFPFADGLQAAIDAGATAVIQPGGSIRDNEVIKAADDAGLAMVFTGMRHFRH
jgi:phosphoribosylaminoimidazolecarboxamide formyltransferase/IMP cyclohydrolase